jgi:predicted transcriptional regulator of viral defense system
LGSHDAAAAIEESGYAKKTGQRVRAAVRRWPGLTTHELARIAHIDRHDVGRRMSELERVGAVRRVQISTVANPTENTKPCSIAGVRAIRWWPK